MLINAPQHSHTAVVALLHALPTIVPVHVPIRRRFVRPYFSCFLVASIRVLPDRNNDHSLSRAGCVGRQSSHVAVVALLPVNPRSHTRLHTWRGFLSVSRLLFLTTLILREFHRCVTSRGSGRVGSGRVGSGRVGSGRVEVTRTDP